MTAPARTRWAATLCTVAMALACGLLASPASAVVVQTPQGRFGYLPLKGEGPAAPSRLNALGNLDYHGGPVMHSNAEYAIFWASGGFAFPPGYTAAVTKYLQDVAADSGKPTNVYSVGTQYTDTSGAHAAYGTSFGGAFDDTDPYPASNGCPLYGGFSRCLSDAQLTAELNGFLASHNLPRGLTATYFLVLPDGIASCLGPTLASGCFDRSGGFCAYHSVAGGGGTFIYANQSFAARDPAGCGTQQYPNGHANGNVDDELSSLSHEANEMITDPLLNAWWNSNTGEENGDQCRLSGNDYGPPLGGVAGAFFNQLINGAGYYLQQEWSNAVIGCQQRYTLTGSATGPNSGIAGKPLAFTATGTDGEGGAITGVDWSFGDGQGGNGATATHVYTAPGTYQVTAQIHNSTGLTVSANAPSVGIRRPSNSFSFGRVKLNKRRGTATLAVRVPNPGTLKLRGRGLARQRKHPDSAGTVKLSVKPRGKVKRTLSQEGNAAVKAKVTYTPKFGVARTKTKKLTLVKKR